METGGRRSGPEVTYSPDLFGGLRISRLRHGGEHKERHRKRQRGDCS